MWVDWRQCEGKWRRGSNQEARVGPTGEIPPSLKIFYEETLKNKWLVQIKAFLRGILYQQKKKYPCIKRRAVQLLSKWLTWQHDAEAGKMFLKCRTQGVGKQVSVRTMQRWYLWLSLISEEIFLTTVFFFIFPGPYLADKIDTCWVDITVLVVSFKGGI